MKNKILIAALITSLSFSVVGCNTDKPSNEQPADHEQEQQQGNEQTNNDQPSNEPTDKNVKQLPKEKELEVIVEGQKEMRKASLSKSDQDYLIYTLTNFTFSAEEPGKDILFSDYDGNYFVRIEKLPSDTNIKNLKENAETELSLLSDVQELKDEEIFDEYFRKAEFFLSSSTSEVSKNIIVINIDNEIFKFTMHIPNGEAAEGIVPSFWAMLKSIQILN